MRKRFTKKILVVGGLYSDDYRIKSITETIGSKMPTKAQYDDGTCVKNEDQVARIVLQNGMIHYMKKGSYIINK
jgi:hypothetical protein